jgi:hypothetical protein
MIKKVLKQLFMFTNEVIMYLHIAPDRIISEIQKEFNLVFPFLKLEFFANRSFSRSNFSANQLIPSSRKIGDNQLVKKDGTLEISADMKVADLENKFKADFNLAVQVFRKSGNLWLETTMTDSWTLEQQNKHGREISTNTHKDDLSEDYDLSRDADH